jgi:hypothetical protein
MGRVNPPQCAVTADAGGMVRERRFGRKIPVEQLLEN